MSNPTICPSALTTASATLGTDKPIVMLNLIRFHALAQYPPTSTAPNTDPPLSGREAYMTHYLPAWRSVADKHGGVEVRFLSTKAVELVGFVGGREERSEEPWDAVALVEYRSLGDFERLVGDAEYGERAEGWRGASVRDWRLVVSLVLKLSLKVQSILNTDRSWQSIDVVLEAQHHVAQTPKPTITRDEAQIFCISYDGAPIEVTAASLGSDSALDFLWEALIRAHSSPRCLLKFVVPLGRGYIIRSNIIEMRLRDTQHIGYVRSFSEPLQTYAGEPVSNTDETDLRAIVSSAAAGLIVAPISEFDGIAVEAELEERLSFDWILPGIPQRKTLALVDANSAHPEEGLGFYRAARELGINIVVLDCEGHWLQDPCQTQWREAFIPTPLTNPPQPDVGNHILASLRTYGKSVDGIVTFADSFWYYIAQIAPELGLHTAPPDSLRIATNKFLTSKYVGHDVYSASSLAEALAVTERVNLSYPLIVKPCDGWSSEGVSRVDSPELLPAAVKAIDTSRHGAEFVIEPYCSGPEVDVNLVLLDGEVLFVEVCDDLPKSADINGPSFGSLTNFHELNSVYPSALPESELQVLIESFASTLLSLGIKNGVMYLEGRVVNSATEYRQEDGIIDLQQAGKSSHQKSPSSWLIEINPRPLGMTGSHIIESTYGIDYWAIAAVSAVDDKARVRALSKPYKSGAQYTAVMVFIPADFPVESEGIFQSNDICADLKTRRPDLAKNISRCATLVKHGEKIKHPSTGKHTFLAYFNVFSRVSRRDALDIAREVRKEVRYTFV